MKYSGKWLIGTSLAVIFGVVAPVWGCCATKMSPREAFDLSSAVFVGRVISIQPQRNELNVIFVVERYWKGSFFLTAVVKTSSREWSTSDRFRIGERYLVYATSTDMCSRTVTYDDAGEDLKVLGWGTASVAAWIGATLISLGGLIGLRAFLFDGKFRKRII